MLLPPPPSLLGLKICTVISVLMGGAGISLPIKVSVLFQGTVSTNGPTTSLLSPTDGIIVTTSSEGQSVIRGQSLFRFKLPSLSVELSNLRAEINDRNSRLATAKIDCSKSIWLSQERLTNSIEVLELNQQAYESEAISKVNLFQYRELLNTTKREHQQLLSDCKREEELLQSEILGFQTNLSSATARSEFVQSIAAPADGSVFDLTVKSGQRVREGEVLAKFTASGSAVAILRIGSEDRPFVSLGNQYEVSSTAYNFMALVPQRPCRISTISPDVVQESSVDTSIKTSTYLASCRFFTPPYNGQYPLLPGMEVQARGISIDSTLAQLLLTGYRNRVLTNPRETAP